tara:strand:- start:4 stop:150 length:147 start_codon:yes stop_codon:yes gene_type:complete
MLHICVPIFLLFNILSAPLPNGITEIPSDPTGILYAASFIFSYDLPTL